MDKIKKILLFHIPMSVCNLRCHYCYLSQRPESFQGEHPVFRYSPAEVAYACRPERIGGLFYCNFCADGETLLTKDIDLYVRAIVEQGHYAEIVTNCILTKELDKFLAWPEELLKRLEFKCSFHYLELKKRGLLDKFASNVKRIWEAGASANIEITPSDELIPFIPEVKEFAMEHFGALPHLTIARDDRTEEIKKLTSLSDEEYERTWSQFDSGFWRFKTTIFGKRQKKFCYAGDWCANINLATGSALVCYTPPILPNVFEHPDDPWPVKAVGRCPIAHCYNGHALLTIGLIPGYDTRYGDIRDRTRADGTHWLQPEWKAFVNTQLCESNRQYGPLRRMKIQLTSVRTKRQIKNIAKKILRRK